jgi:GNAT superfamily N-acetyltransferase
LPEPTYARSVDPVVTRLTRDDVVVVDELVRLINRAYVAGEAGLWRSEPGRTDAREIAEAVRAGHMLVARVDGRIAGCLRTRSLDTTTATLGLVGVDPNAWGGGIGRALVDAAEDLARSGGATTMQLELLVPRTGTHPDKQRLREWYTRRGYTVTRRIPFEDYVPQAAPFLAAPADILLFTKPLHPH